MWYFEYMLHSKILEEVHEINTVQAVYVGGCIYFVLQEQIYRVHNSGHNKMIISTLLLPLPDLPLDDSSTRSSVSFGLLTK